MASSDRQLAQTGTQEAPSEHQGISFQCKDDHALAQFAQRGSGVCIPGDIKKCLVLVLDPVVALLEQGVWTRCTLKPEPCCDSGKGKRNSVFLS